MAWKMIGYIARLYLAYTRLVERLVHDLKSQFHREIEVAGNLIMSLPMLALILWLMGVK